MGDRLRTGTSALQDDARHADRDRDAVAAADAGQQKTTKLTRPAWTLRPETTLTLANIVYAVSESSRAAMTVGEVMAVKWIAATFNETAPSTPRLKPRMWTERDTEMSASTSQSRPTFWR